MEKQSEERKQKELDREASQNEQIRETGQAVLDGNFRKHKVELLTVIGEIEGHESAPSHSKTTKYEHVLPKLALIEDDEEIEGLLILLNTVGGDVEAGLAIAEMIASLSIPTVSLVLGGGYVGLQKAGRAGSNVLSDVAVTQKIKYLEDIIDQNYLEDVDEDSLKEGIYTGLLYGLGDPYSRYGGRIRGGDERHRGLLLWNRREHYPKYGGWYSGGGLL